jgi:hypothetical protein
MLITETVSSWIQRFQQRISWTIIPAITIHLFTVEGDNHIYVTLLYFNVTINMK